MTLQLFDPLFLVPRAIRRNPLRAVYAGEAIRHFGVGLFSIFEPAYLFLVFRDAGYPHPAAWVFLYYAALFLLFGAASVFAVRLIPRFGFRALTLMSLGFFFLYFSALFQARTTTFFLLPALLFIVIRAALFWPPFHLFFARASKSDHRGEALGNTAVFTALAGAASPALGGMVLALWGYPALFFLVLMFLLLSAVPYFSAEIREGHRGGFRPVLREVRERGGTKAALAFFGQGIEDGATAHAWPLFLFLLALGYEKLGWLTSVALVASLVVTLLVGRLADHRDRSHLLVMGAPLASFMWIFRIAAISPFTVLVANLATGLTRPLAHIPFSALFYDRVASAGGGEPMHLVLFREITLNSGRVVLYLVGAAVAWFSGDLRWLFLLPIPAMLAMVLLVTWARFVPAASSSETRGASFRVVG